MKTIGPLFPVLLLAAAFVAGRSLGILDRKYCGRRRFLSAAAGASVAYVFVQVLPELAEYQARFLEAHEGYVAMFPEYRVYIAALLGFVLFYGLDTMVCCRREAAYDRDDLHHGDALFFTIHIAGFAVYAGLISYLIQDWSFGSTAKVLYIVAMVFHFLVIDHSLRVEYGVGYDRNGRWWLAVAVIAGWVSSALITVPMPVVATAQGFVAGGVTINSVKDEMPETGQGRFGWFGIGALAFGLLMILGNAE